MKLTNEDKDDLLKYARYFALKASQIIISSRQKGMKSTPCRQKSDWFNLNITSLDDAETNAIRKTVTNKFFAGVPVCVEIYGKSTREDKGLVETWCIQLSSEYSDPNPKITTFSIYNQIGILLKSLLSITRIIPGFELTKLSNETCKIHYRIYEGEPNFEGLGKVSKHISIGRISTPIGTLQITVDYRPKVELISSKKPMSEEGSMLYESNYFSSDSESKPKLTINYQGNNKLSRYTIPFAKDLPTPPKRTVPALRPGGVPWYPKKYEKFSSEENPNSPTCDDKISMQAAKPTEELNKTDPGCPSDSMIIKEIDPKEELSPSGKSVSGEYVMSVMSKYRSKYVPKARRYTFATDTRQSEISNFYRECSNAPILTCWNQSTSVKDIDVTQQLDAFEEKIKEFDDLVRSLAASPDSDN